MSAEGGTNFEAIAKKNFRKTIKRVFHTQSRALAAVPKRLDNRTVEKVLKALIDARRIYCYGVGRSGPLVREAEYCFVRAGLNCIGIQDEAQMAIQSSQLTSEDAVLAFSRTGRNRRTVEGVGLARNAGATIIGVTAQADSPLSQVSDIPLTLSEDVTRSGVPTSHLRMAESTLILALASCINLCQATPATEPSEVDKHVETIVVGLSSNVPRNDDDPEPDFR